MAERLIIPSLAVPGYGSIRHTRGAVVLEPSLTSISQFSLAIDPPLEADVPVTIKYRLAGNSNGHVFAVAMGAATTPRSGDDFYEETIVPLGETSAIQFRTSANTDGTLSDFSVDDSPLIPAA